MFSVDDSFELSEEDFLQAALSIENASQVSQNNNNRKHYGSYDIVAGGKETSLPFAVGSQMSSDLLDSESQSPVISLVGPCGRQTGGIPSVNTKVLSPMLVSNNSSPETGSSAGVRKFSFKRSPNSASPALGCTSGFTSSAKTWKESPKFDNVTTGVNDAASCTLQSGTGTSLQACTSAEQSKAEGQYGMSNNRLFVVSQDNLDSDLDLSLDSDPLKMFACKSPVNAEKISSIGKKVLPNSHTSTFCEGTINNTLNPNTSGTHSNMPKNNEQYSGLVHNNTATSSSKSQVVFKTPQSSPALSRLRNFQHATSNGNTTPTTSRTAVLNTPKDSPSDHSHNRPDCGWGTPPSNRSSASSATSLASSIGKRKRKFPGPAGLLPKLKRGMTLEEANKLQLPEVPSSPATPKESVPDLAGSQSSEDGLLDGPWKMMKEDLEPQANAILEEFSVSSIQKKAAKKMLPKGKVPVVCVLVESVSNASDDASVVLKDKTGKIQGTMHRQLMKDHLSEMIPGTVLVLRQVGVFSPSNRSHYLNITPNNIVRIYTKSESGAVKKSTLSEFCSDDYVIPEPCPQSPLQAGALTPRVPGPLGQSSAPRATLGEGQRNSYMAPRYQFRPRLSGSPANGGSLLFGGRPNIPARGMLGQQGMSTPGVSASRPFTPQIKQNSQRNLQIPRSVNQSPAPAVINQRQNVPPGTRPQNLNPPWQKIAPGQAQTQSGRVTLNPVTTGPVTGHTAGTANQLNHNQNTGNWSTTAGPKEDWTVSGCQNGGQGMTTEKKSVEDLWQDSDEQLDDLLTGIGDELFDAF